MSLQEAIEYGKRGWRVFPLLPRSKAPACSHGFHDAVSNEAAIRQLWGARTNLNVGIATGEISGFWVLDVDEKSGGLQSLEEMENRYGSLPKTLLSKTGGGGKHYVFKMPKGVNIGCAIGKIAKGIDTRGNGGYIAAPPSVHPTGQTYVWEEGEIAEAPNWLIRLITAVKPAAPKAAIAAPVVIGDWSQDDVISMLDYVSPDDREVWIKVGMALHASGWPVSMWDTWSRGSQKYKMGETFRIWNGFKPDGNVTMGSLVYMAQDGGWVAKAREHEPLDFSNVSGVDLREFKAALLPPAPPAPPKSEIGGLIGDTLAWINSSSIKLQPELSTMHIIATLGSVFGRRYALQKLNTRTNIYMVGIAESGQGKDNSRTCLPRLLRQAGLEQFSGPEDIRTGPGLLLELKKQPSFIANIDEFGMFMRALSDPKAANYLREISTIFTRIYSKSGTFYRGGLIASAPDDRIVLNEPNLCIYGTTTISSYAEAMRKASIESGELNRFIVAKTPTDFPEPNYASCYSDPPESLVTRWNKFAPTALAAAPDIIEQEKVIVMLGDQAQEVDNLLLFQDKMHKEHRAMGMGALWVRYRENILKVAMILAITRDPVKPQLIASDIEFGKSLVGGSILFMIKFCTNTMYDSDFQKKCSIFMEAIDAGVTSRTDMIRRMGIKSKELDDIERALKEMGKINFEEKERPRQYRLL